MDVGINLFPAVGPQDKPADQFYDEALRLAECADALGYHHVKAVEHHLSPYGGYSPDPVALLSAIAVRTERIRLVTGAVIPAFSHPIRLASRLAQLDNLSKGRLDVGFGRAFLPLEFEAFQVPMAQSRARFEETVAACSRLWQEQDVVWEGEFHQFGPVTTYPRPYQRPHPPVFVAATSSLESVVAAGRAGRHLMLVPAVASGPEQIRQVIGAHRSAWEQAGHPVGAAQVHLTYSCCVAERRAEAVELAQELERSYLVRLLDAAGSMERADQEQYPGYRDAVKHLGEQDFSEALAANKILAGTPQEVRGQVRTLRAWFGDAVTLSLVFTYGTLPYAAAERSLRLFAGQVRGA
jgi:alkanesulfonate monooxygenase SsuD/methylene tetrahydromethanopterin reductase-like flavin-dependent oxidoreductase (luciferase family)